MGMPPPLLSLPPLAQDVPDAVSSVFNVLSETILGVVLVLVIFGYLWAKPAVESLKDENNNLRVTITGKDEELKSLRASIESHVIPSIEKNAHVADRVVALLEENKDTSRRLAEVLERIEKR